LWERQSFLLILARVEAKSREMLVQVYRDNTIKKTAVYKWWHVFLRKRKCHRQREIRTASNQHNWRKHRKKFVKLCVKINGWLSGAHKSKQSSTKKQENLTEDLNVKVCAKMVSKDLLTQHCLWGSF
jgi:hypothetical protein